MMNHKELKRLRRELGLNDVSELLALSMDSDPFYAPDIRAKHAAAEWFAKQSLDSGFKNGSHLRGMHYKLFQVVRPLKPDGTVYDNTKADWEFLSMGSRCARYLGLIDPCDFADKQNKPPQTFAGGRMQDYDECADVSMPYWSLPAISADLSSDLSEPDVCVSGYGYSEDDQPYLVEVWIEKSTMDYVLEPLARELHFNLVVGKGYESITAVVNLLERINNAQKPARVFYISDFDPGGDNMPVQVSRQIEFWRPKYAPGYDIALTQLALTREQVEKYNLPRNTLKDSDNRKVTFEGIYGVGATELDALDGIYPGELEKIVRQAIEPYRDMTLADRLQEADDDAQEKANSAWDSAMEPHADELVALEEEAKAIAEKYQPKLSRLSEKMEAELAPIRERVKALRETVSKEAEEFDVEIPSRPEAEAEGADEIDWLYRSDRDYMEQLAAYKARRNGHCADLDC